MLVLMSMISAIRCRVCVAQVVACLGGRKEALIREQNRKRPPRKGATSSADARAKADKEAQRVRARSGEAEGFTICQLTQQRLRCGARTLRLIRLPDRRLPN